LGRFLFVLSPKEELDFDREHITNHKQQLKYIDLFAGCGGLSLGLYNSGYWQGLFAVERNADAFKTLSYNLLDRARHFDWPQWLEKKNLDIKEVLREHQEGLSELKGKVDLVAGGPPCQGFSFAGRRRPKGSQNGSDAKYKDLGNK
jgi:DNA (cytosine-5)-methyltransferase 1